MLSPPAQAHGGKLACGALVRVIEAGKFQRHGHIFQRGHRRNEVERLEYDADIAPTKSCQRIFAQRVEGLARNDHRAGIDTLQSGHDHEQSRFARA